MCELLSAINGDIGYLVSCDKAAPDKMVLGDLLDSSDHYPGPQGEILRNDNMVRCVRDINRSSDIGESETDANISLTGPAMVRCSYLEINKI